MVKTGQPSVRTTESYSTKTENITLVGLQLECYTRLYQRSRVAIESSAPCWWRSLISTIAFFTFIFMMKQKRTIGKVR